MKKAMQLQDSRADKFWRIETMGVDLMVNWGKKGSSGHYEMYRFPSEDRCLKEAAKLSQDRRDKGYSDYPEFDPMDIYYYDDDTMGLHPLTSHPLYRKYFTSPFYYSNTERSVPFGSDEGSDALWEMEEVLRRRPKADLRDFPAHVLRKLHSLAYYPPHGESVEELRRIDAAASAEAHPSLKELRSTDRMIIASALAQLKITGSLSEQLYQLALLAITRLERIRGLGQNVWLTSSMLMTIQRDLKLYRSSLSLAQQAVGA